MIPLFLSCELLNYLHLFLMRQMELLCSPLHPKNPSGSFITVLACVLLFPIYFAVRLNLPFEISFS